MYSRSNSVPRSTGNLLVSVEVLRNELKNKRKLKQEKSLAYEEEEDEEYDLCRCCSSDENESSVQANVSADNVRKPASSGDLSCLSMANLDNKLQNLKA